MRIMILLSFKMWWVKICSTDVKNFLEVGVGMSHVEL